MTNETTPGSFDELLDMIPQILGYVPDEQLVVMVFSGPRLIVTGARDLGDTSSDGGIRRAMSGGDGVIVVAYSADGDAGQAALDALVVWSPLEIIATTVITESVEVRCAKPGNMELERQGVQMPRGTRAEMQAKQYGGSVTAADEWADEKKNASTRGAVNNVELMGWIETHLTGDVTLADAAWLMSVLGDESRMQAVLVMITRDRADQHYEWWRQIVVMADNGDCLPAAILAGYAAWCSGNGVALNWIIERAWQWPGAAEHWALQVLDAVSQKGVSPDEWGVVQQILVMGR